MSKTKLAVLVFALAFGVNIFAFVFSQKAYLIEEVKNVWLYELPLTASPLDSYVAKEMGPQNGVIGTLFHLMDKFEWKPATGKTTPSVLTVKLKPELTFSTHEAILPEHWIKSREWALPYLQLWKSDSLWGAYVSAEVEWKSATEVQFSWKNLPAQFDAHVFMEKILSHPMTGVLHPQNLAAMRLAKAEQGKKLGKEWISSGSYRVRKWNPKEIILISRDDFPVAVPKEFFRTLKFQSAPVKNPSCEFMQAQPGEEKALSEHRINVVDQTLHVFWICRSWKEAGSFCASPQNRESFSKLISDQEQSASPTLVSQKVRYRIPFGSDAFRNEITQKLITNVKMMGGSTEEVSYFFKPSTDSDIELLMMVTDSSVSSEIAEKMAIYSSRVNLNGVEIQPNLIGEFAKYPIQVLMKNMKGDPFTKVFMEPDLEEKKLPL
jgi:hypothetical protein